MGRTRRSNKLQSRVEVFPCPRKLGVASASRRRSPYFGSISSNTPRFRICATSTAFTPRCSTVGRRSSSRTPLSHSSTAPAAPATTRTGGSPCWNKSCNASTKSSPNSWRNISNQKKNLGNSERSLGFPVHPRCGRPVRPALGWPHEPADLALGRLAGDCHEQVQPLKRAAGNTQPAQRLPPPRFLARGLGAGRDHRLPCPLPPGRISAVGLHDARRRRRGRQPLQRLPRAQGGGQAGSPRRQAFQEGTGLRAALAAS